MTAGLGPVQHRLELALPFLESRGAAAGLARADLWISCQALFFPADKAESEVPLRSHGSLSLHRALMAAGLVAASR